MGRYFQYKNELNPAKGRLLISEPFLPDPNFERTVVLICEHNEEGSFGFVLNKKSKVYFDDIMEEVEGFKKDIYIGGPVQQDTLHFIHRSPSVVGGVKIGEGIYWGGDFDQVMTMINTRQINDADFRFFVGYSGWGEGQLEQELEADSWIVSPEVNDALVFDLEAQDLWRTVLKQMGGRYNMYSNYPQDPRLN